MTTPLECSLDTMPSDPVAGRRLCVVRVQGARAATFFTVCSSDALDPSQVFMTCFSCRFSFSFRLNRHLCAQENSPDQLSTGRSLSGHSTFSGLGEGHTQTKAQTQLCGKPICNNLEQTATNSFTRAMLSKDAHLFRPSSHPFLDS